MSKRGKHPNSLSNLEPFLLGNQAARKHGGYARHFDPTIAEQIEQSDGNNIERIESLIRLEQMRLHSVLQTKARYDARGEYNELSASDLELSEVTSGADGTLTKRQRPNFEQVIDRNVGRLLALIAEQERIAASPAHVASRLSEVLDEAQASGMSAADTAEQCERAGIAPPFSLQQRVRAELALVEPPEPEGGVTDDELERLSAEYQEEVEGEVAWLEQRREEVARMHESKQQEKQGQ
ncbi:hypothetical protein HLB35_15905 [Halomonas sp. TBZ9]|uniref:Uncharacterized protein n=1 Tax=Vreelandella azerica TaxID=2732867 RepID=A0A7Y3XC01_9GAMM|nr:hypothetical protein [Halomonas azerica]NOG32879.1 hypothetical protein [Halomonas azerica]